MSPSPSLIQSAANQTKAVVKKGGAYSKLLSLRCAEAK